jgi:hypothetical protein
MRGMLNRLEISFVNKKQLRIKAVSLRKKELFFPLRFHGEVHPSREVFNGGRFW